VFIITYQVTYQVRHESVFIIRLQNLIVHWTRLEWTNSVMTFRPYTSRLVIRLAHTRRIAWVPVRLDCKTGQTCSRIGPRLRCRGTPSPPYRACERSEKRSGADRKSDERERNFLKTVERERSVERRKVVAHIRSPKKWHEQYHYSQEPMSRLHITLAV